MKCSHQLGCLAVYCILNVLSAGYVIGLGDRHSANLLLDQVHAEVVHIDLGIAFEQGRFLNTPEMVPFRLTRDIVDGMGVIGEAILLRWHNYKGEQYKRR